MATQRGPAPHHFPVCAANETPHSCIAHRKPLKGFSKEVTFRVHIFGKVTNGSAESKLIQKGKQVKTIGKKI